MLAICRPTFSLKLARAVTGQDASARGMHGFSRRIRSMFLSIPQINSTLRSLNLAIGRRAKSKRHSSGSKSVIKQDQRATGRLPTQRSPFKRFGQVTGLADQQPYKLIRLASQLTLNNPRLHSSPPKKLAPPRAPACFPSNSATQARSPALQITASSPQAPFPSVPFCRLGALRSEAFLRPREATWLESLPNWARTWFLILWTRLWRSFSRMTASSRAAA